MPSFHAVMNVNSPSLATRIVIGKAVSTGIFLMSQSSRTKTPEARLVWETGQNIFFIFFIFFSELKRVCIAALAYACIASSQIYPKIILRFTNTPKDRFVEWAARFCFA